MDWQHLLLGHQKGRVVLMRARQHGLSLIELMIGVVILCFSLMAAAPTFADWMRNAQIRSAAETLNSAIQLARTEAVKRNATTRFQLVDELTANCSLTTSGANWVVNLTSSTTPESHCDATPGSTSTPFVIQSGPAGANSSTVGISASQEVVSFNGLGQQVASTNPDEAVAQMTIDVTPTSGTCLASGGTTRCLRVLILTTGQSRVCDPSLTDATAANGMRC